MIAWQAQIAGKKQWYLQSPLRNKHVENFPDKAFEDIIIDPSHGINENAAEKNANNGRDGNDDDDTKDDGKEGEGNNKRNLNNMNKTLVYKFDIYPGEVLVWNVQYYHNSSTTERSLSLTSHVRY